MSDTSQGPGWWQASDGKWYSPEQAPAAQAAPPPPAVASGPAGQVGQPQWGQQAPSAAMPNGLGQPKKSHTARNVLIAVGVLGVLLIGGCAALLVAGGAAVDKAADSIDESIDEELKSSAETTPGSGDVVDSGDAPTTESSFVDGVLTTPEMIIKITETRTIPVGAAGNEYGDKPVIVYWYEITNLTGGDVSPMNWIYVFSAYQDNNPNAVNELEVASLPDDRFLESQMETIKQGGTVENAVAYELDDETTPVDLVASEGLGLSEIGKFTHNLG